MRNLIINLNITQQYNFWPMHLDVHANLEYNAASIGRIGSILFSSRQRFSRASKGNILRLALRVTPARSISRVSSTSDIRRLVRFGNETLVGEHNGNPFVAGKRRSEKGSEEGEKIKILERLERAREEKAEGSPLFRAFPLLLMRI